MNGPFTDRDYRRLNEVLTALEGTHREVERAKEAGFECDPEDAACRDIIGRLKKFKAVYFPERP